MSKILTGKVVSVKMLKTVIVEVESRRPHPLYKKIVRKTARHKVHNDNFKVAPGDRVKITETRPISGEKHFKLMEIISHRR